MKISDFKGSLNAGKALIGSWLQIPSTDIAEIIGCAGYDWVAVDLEHGSFVKHDLPDIFRALELGGTIPFARLADTKMTSIKESLDSGAQGLIFPMIETRQQLDSAINLSLYPPNGTRGVGYCRANLFGRNFEKGISSNTDAFFCAQIENIRALNNLDEILQHPRLGAVMVGPYDMSSSMGLRGDLDHPDFIAALEIILEKSRSHGIPMGIHVVQPDENRLRERISEGYLFIAYGIDAVFLGNGAERPKF